MDDGQLMTILVVFVGLIALAMVTIMVCAVAVLVNIRRVTDRATRFLDRWEPVAESAQQAVTEFTEQSGELLARLNQVSAMLHKQVLQVDSGIAHIVETAQRNVEDVDRTVRAILKAVESTTKSLDHAVHLPSKKLRAVAEGLRAGMRRIGQARTKDPRGVSADEEMFI